MNILFTGASSFTGMWFVKTLVEHGHQVTALFKRPVGEYDSIRLKRVKVLEPICQCVFGVKFGDDTFLELLQGPRIDILCHHAADVTDYKSSNFDPIKALENNTNNIRKVIEKLRAHNGAKLVLTGSVFEQREGSGTKPLHAISPYGLSKGLSYDLISYYAKDLVVGKFVIPNPFGPYEESRFTAYLIDTWINEKVAQVKTPCYIRDNVPVDLLAKAYARFVQQVAYSSYNLNTHPSFYVESQGNFALRVAEKMRNRLQIPCEVQICEQESFTEPMERINTDNLDWRLLGLNEETFWDNYAEYYQKQNILTQV